MPTVPEPSDPDATQKLAAGQALGAVSIRRCGPGDETALSLVGQASFLEAFAGAIPGRDIVKHCIRQHGSGKYAGWLGDPKSAVWIAEVDPDRAPVGYLVLTSPDLPVSDPAETDAEIKRIYILHRFQGLGVGAALMRHVDEFAVGAGVRRLLLGVYSKNSAAIGFYEKLGYRKIGRRTFTVGDGAFEDFVLGRTISN